MKHIIFFLQLIFFLILSLHLVNSHPDDDDDDDDDSKCVRLTSAFNYLGDVYLVSGNEYFLIDSDLKETDHGTLEDEFDAPKGNIDAALMYSGELYFFQGSQYFSYDYLYYIGLTGAATKSSKWGGFFKSGLDAAATLGDTSYFFHGCEYAKGHGVYEIHPMDDLGLPCHVDAAWNQDDKIYITLENNVWIMDENEHVTGPESLSKLVTLTSTSICHNDPFLEKVRKEQMYEKEHKCTIIDAAITFDGTVYIFNDNEYITLDDAGNEIDKANIFRWGGLPGNIDAGVVYSGDNHAYFFQGNDYYKYFYGFLYNLASGPRSNSFWGPFFGQGIDAAGNHKGESYFFKGCEMLNYEANTTISSPDLKLPCDVDAAFTRDGTLYVIKRNQVWTWHADEEVADKPTSLITAVNITSWSACPPEEK